MKKIFFLLVVIFTAFGCTNEGYKAEKNVVKLSTEKTTIKNSPKFYINTFSINDSETFFYDNADILNVIDNSVKTSIVSGKGSFDIDYAYFRNVGNTNDKRYVKEDLEVLKESLVEAITANGLGTVTTKIEEADYVINLEINTSFIMKEGSAVIRGIVSYMYSVNKKEINTAELIEKGVTYESLKAPIKNSINGIIQEDILTKIDEIEGNKNINSEFYKKYGTNIEMYDSMIEGLKSLIILRKIKRVEGSSICTYDFGVNWYRFYIEKK